MFHWRDNLYFGRVEGGAVRIVKFSRTPDAFPKPNDVVKDETAFDVVIPATEWASIIASMSKRGESNGGYDRAVNFHNGKG